MIENSPPEAKKIEMTQFSTCATAAAILYGIILFSSNEFLFWFVRTYCTTLVKHVFSNTNGVCCWYCVRMVCTGRVVVLGACQVGLALCTFEWRWAMLFVKSLLLGACQVDTWHVNCQSEWFFKTYVWTCFGLQVEWAQTSLSCHPNSVETTTTRASNVLRIFVVFTSPEQSTRSSGCSS